MDGDHAYDHGVYEISGERDGKAWGPVRGKYVIVWRREKGTWRMELDMWNSGPEHEVLTAATALRVLRIVVAVLLFIHGAYRLVTGGVAGFGEFLDGTWHSAWAPGSPG